MCSLFMLFRERITVSYVGAKSRKLGIDVKLDLNWGGKGGGSSSILLLGPVFSIVAALYSFIYLVWSRHF